MTILIVKRVSYGKKDTPLEKREYRLFAEKIVNSKGRILIIKFHSTPVGFISEWKEFASKHNYSKVEFIDKDKTFSQCVF